jgi:hypothetical protein
MSTNRTYEVCGSNAVLGHEPGSTFSADLTDAQAQFYLDGGHLKTVTAAKKVPPKKRSPKATGEKPASQSGGEQKETK